MRIAISFAALFLSVALVQLGSGALGPLDALAGLASGFTSAEIGLLGSSHFIGFFIGCWLIPRLLGSVGHSRTFAFCAAIGALSALLHPVFRDPYVWAVLRIGSGLAVAGAYTIVESWLQAKVENANRGRVFGVYRLVDMAASLVAQGMVAVLDPTDYVAYNILAAMGCLCLMPLTLTKTKPPVATRAPRLRPLRAIAISPLAAAAVITVGLSSAGFRMVGPLYAAQIGFATTEVAAFMAAGVAGGALAQWPVGWLSDALDRRKILIGLSAAAILVCLGLAIFSGGATVAYIGVFLFGAATFPLYSVAAAHANDFADMEEVVDLNAALVFLFGVGAIVSPLAAATLIERFGPGALFAYVATAHAALIFFGLWRMSVRGPSDAKTTHQYVPRTTFTLGRFIRPRRK